jgi:putative membrane protein
VSASTAELTPRRLHPASPFIGLILQSRQLVLPLIVGLVAGARDRGAGEGPELTTYLFLGLPVLIALLQFLGWGRFRYSVAGGALVIDSGFLNRSHREIPLDRIHHVEEVAKLVHRLFGVVRLVVDSGAGGSSPEAKLDALSKREAALLRSVLEGRPSEPGPVIRNAPGAAPPLVKIGPGQLFAAGLTNVSVLPTLTVIGTLFQLLDDFIPEGEFVESTVDRAPLTIGGVLAGVGFVGGAWLLFAGLGSLVAHYGFVLERRDHELRTQRGLLDRRRAVADLRRLTAIRITETLSRRALGLCELRLQTVSGSSSSGVSRLWIPVIERRRVPELVGEFLGRTDELPELASHPPAARRRLLVRRLAVSLVPAGALSWFWPPTGLVVGILLLVLAVLRAELAYRHLGHGTDGTILVTQSGGLRRRQAVASWAHGESTRLRSTPMQRWAGLATLKLDLPQGGSVAVVDADPARLAEIRQLALRRPPGP